MNRHSYAKRRQVTLHSLFDSVDEFSGDKNFTFVSLPSIIFVESVKVLQTRHQVQPDLFLEAGRERAPRMRLAFVRANGAGLTLEAAASLVVSWKFGPHQTICFNMKRFVSNEIVRLRLWQSETQKFVVSKKLMSPLRRSGLIFSWCFLQDPLTIAVKQMHADIVTL